MRSSLAGIDSLRTAELSTAAPARDQPGTLPTKVKVITTNVVTSPMGTTTEETTTVKTTSQVKSTTPGEMFCCFHVGAFVGLDERS